MTVFSSGISMYAMAKLIGALRVLDAPLIHLGLPPGWGFHISVLVSAAVVLAYIYLGGLRGAIYNEVLQFFLIVAGFAPLVWLGLRAVGGWQGLSASLPSAYLHVWRGMASPATNPLGVEWFGLVAGLGFVLSFGYWCTDFLIVQRAMAADSMDSARRTPLIAASIKMVFPFLVIVPGLIAMSLTASAARVDPARLSAYASHAAAVQTPIIPVKTDASGKPVLDTAGKPELDYDLATPNLLLRYFPSGMLGVGLTALLASFMSGMAGNVTAFNTVWTYDIYQAYVRPGASDHHYLNVGRWATFAGVTLSIAAAYLAAQFNNIMDLLQLVFAFVNAPVFATFLLGMFWKRATGHGAFAGLAAGTVAAALHHGLSLPAGAAPGVQGGWIAAIHLYPSQMAQNFWTAIFSWTTCFAVTVLVSLATKAHDEQSLVGLVHSLTPRPANASSAWWRSPVFIGMVVLTGALILNWIFR